MAVRLTQLAAVNTEPRPTTQTNTPVREYSLNVNRVILIESIKMGLSQSTPTATTTTPRSDFSVDVIHKKDETIQTILKTKHFKFALIMRANKVESERLQERWQDFTSNTRDNFIYHTATKNPQYIKVVRDGDKMYFTQSTTLEIDETDVKNLTKMFDTISTAINDRDKTDVLGLWPKNDATSASSLNLLVTDKASS